MRISIIAVGEKPPAWVQAGYAEFAKRLPHPLTPQLVEIPLGARGKGRDPARAIAEEGAAVLRALPKQARVVALDERGKHYTSQELAGKLTHWQREGLDIALLIGGPDGHAPEVIAAAHEKCSLSALTLPHMLVRLVLIEQLYRAWSINQGHPYHRE
jgi:23S rRNA (pseudouridine1915-N3)-methyltransferase